MSGSSEAGKNAFLHWLQGISSQVHTIVDCGAGQGTYRKLFNELVDKKIFQPGAVRWIAVEGYAPYIERYKLKELYDEVICCPLEECFEKISQADLFVMGDVLEHLSLEKALLFIKNMKEKYDPLIYLSLPIVYYPQEKEDNNALESHQHHWHFNEVYIRFLQLGLSMNGMAHGIIGVFRNWLTFANPAGIFLAKNPPIPYGVKVCAGCQQYTPQFKVPKDLILKWQQVPETGDVGIFPLSSGITPDIDLSK